MYVCVCKKKCVCVCVMRVRVFGRKTDIYFDLYGTFQKHFGAWAAVQPDEEEEGGRRERRY